MQRDAGPRLRSWKISAAVSLIEALSDRDRLQQTSRLGGPASALRWGGDLARRSGLGRWLVGDGLGEIVDIDEHPSCRGDAARPISFVARDRRNSQGAKRARWRPRYAASDAPRAKCPGTMSLGLIDRLPCPRETAARGGPQDRRDRFQEAMIRRVCLRIWPTASGRSISSSRSRTQAPTLHFARPFRLLPSAIANHEVVIGVIRSNSPAPVARRHYEEDSFFFAPVWTRLEVSFSGLDWPTGRLPDDDDNQQSRPLIFSQPGLFGMPGDAVIRSRTLAMAGRHRRDVHR